jgi:hypothetical protein
VSIDQRGTQIHTGPKSSAPAERPADFFSSAALALRQRIRPFAVLMALMLGLLLTVLWIGALGYGLVWMLS